MARRKKAKSLFEVITHPPRPADTPPAATSQQHRPTGTPQAPGTGAPRKASGRPTVAISQFHAVSLGTGVVLLVLLALLWGRSIGIRSARGAGGGTGPLNLDLISGSGADAGLPPMVKDDFKREKDHWYLVIHKDIASPKDGLAIKRFFHRNGVEVTVNPDPDPSMRSQFVIEDTVGFPARGDPRDCSALGKRQELLSILCQVYVIQTRSGRIPGRPYDFKKFGLATER